MSDGTRVVLVKPGDVLIFGNVGDVPPEAIDLLRPLGDRLGLADICVFSGDIDIAAARGACKRRHVAQRPTPGIDLAEVAEVYRANIDNRPREAVAEAFGLGLRTASRRIEDARNAGHLPFTTQGKAQA